VALSLGLRRGEALGLRWSDVNLDNGLLRVNQALHRVDGAIKRGDVKTDGSTEDVTRDAVDKLDFLFRGAERRVTLRYAWGYGRVAEQSGRPSVMSRETQKPRSST
jgi:integrase